MTLRTVLIDDDAEVLEALSETLTLAGFKVAACRSWSEARLHAKRDMTGVVLTDVRMSGRDGFGVLAEIHEIDPQIPVVLISGHADVPMALEAMRQGAYDFIEKPAEPPYVVELLKRAAEHRALVLAHRQLRSLVQSKAIEARIIGISPVVIRLRDMIVALAQVDATVLVQGETGTGKELVARSLHDFGPRSRGPFVAINCAALPGSIIESELFGHEAGAFTGAKDRRIGRIEQAHQGSLFLDEIESMSMDAQQRLLRVLQERRLVRLGGQREIDVDVRVIAATKADLTKLAAHGQFREDLVYRLNVIPLVVPPLRERGPRDIELLFRHFFEDLSSRLGARAAPIPRMDQLLRHCWPGNVRELRNAAERAALGFPALAQPIHREDELHSPTLAEIMAGHERRELEIALARGGQLQKTAADLGISRKTLYLKLRDHGLGSGDDADGRDG